MLPGIGFQELFFIAVIALVVVGPKDLPLMMRKLGQFMAKGKALAGEFQAAFNDIARQAELDELRKEIEDLKKVSDVQDAVDEMRDFERDMNDSVMRDEAKAKPDKDTAAAPDEASVKTSDAAPKAGAEPAK